MNIIIYQMLKRNNLLDAKRKKMNTKCNPTNLMLDLYDYLIEFEEMNRLIQHQTFRRRKI